MEIVTILKQKTVKQQISDILLDISWAKISNKYFGRSASWLYQKLDGGVANDFTYSEKIQLKNALLDFSERIRKAAENIDT